MNNKEIIPCYVERFLSIQLREHQKEGVKFMFDCVCGLKNSNIKGCILAVLKH